MELVKRILCLLIGIGLGLGVYWAIDNYWHQPQQITGDMPTEVVNTPHTGTPSATPDMPHPDLQVDAPITYKPEPEIITLTVYKIPDGYEYTGTLAMFGGVNLTTTVKGDKATCEGSPWGFHLTPHILFNDETKKCQISWSGEGNPIIDGKPSFDPKAVIFGEPDVTISHKKSDLFHIRVGVTYNTATKDVGVEVEPQIKGVGISANLNTAKQVEVGLHFSAL